MDQSKRKFLVVDLDGTLLRSDMLHESFWSALGKNWCAPFMALAALARGKAALKAFLRAEAEIDITSLPFNELVVDYVRAYRLQGGRTILVTASNEAFAQSIAQHLMIFDEAYGSDSIQNLKGENKAIFIFQRFGDEGFCYMGDSSADIHVWRMANTVVTVNAAPHVRRQAERLGKPFEHLVTLENRLSSHLKTLRFHQWLKNILIFLPMLAAHQLNTATILSSLLAFIAFSLFASSVYIINDLLDLKNDRSHPRKRLRPFASGAVPIANGGFLALSLLLTGALIAVLLNENFLFVLVLYYAVTTAYSLSLKRNAILDICVLAGLYTLRVIAGGVATGIPLSEWLLAFTGFFFLSLAAVKRQAELVDLVKRGNLMAEGRGYRVEDLPIISHVSLTAGYISILVLALYVNSSTVQDLYPTPGALWGICCILLFWLTRMVIIAHRGTMHDDPVMFALKDGVSQVCFLIILSFAAVGAIL